MSVSLPDRVLLVGRDMLGDLVNTTGAVRALVEAYPATHFVFEGGLAAPEIGFAAQEVIARPRHTGLLGRLRRILTWRKHRFGACVVLDDGHTHARLARMAGIRTVYGIHRGKPSLFTGSVEFDRGKHDLFDQLGPLLRVLGLEADIRPFLVPSDADFEQARAQFSQLGEPEILVHPGASDFKKTWPDLEWAELLHHLGYRVAVIGGTGEQADRFGRPSPAQPLRVLEYAALLSMVRVLVTPDTGPAHLAAAMGTATVVIYGPTDPRHFHPWDNGNQELLYVDRGCRHYGLGCAHLQGGRCPQECTQEISVDRVISAVARLTISD